MGKDLMSVKYVMPGLQRHQLYEDTSKKLMMKTFPLSIENIHIIERIFRVTHLTNKPIFQCEMCPTTCGRMTDLRYHIKKQHTASEPLKCGMCNSLFPDKYSLKVTLEIFLLG